jgi:hypothetical protein
VSWHLVADLSTCHQDPESKTTLEGKDPEQEPQPPAADILWASGGLSRTQSFLSLGSTKAAQGKG